MRKSLRKQGSFYAEITLENCYNDASSVEVFGEFSKNPWKEKVSLNKSVTNNVWKVDLNIKIGQ